MNDLPLPSNKFYSSFNKNLNHLPTKVLLILIYNKNSTLITHDILYNCFEKYGEVHKILIFEKNRVWKAFIEMKTIEMAQNAQNDLNNTFLLEDGSKMDVHFSNMKSLDLKNNNSGGMDYQILKNNHFKTIKSKFYESNLFNFEQYVDECNEDDKNNISPNVPSNSSIYNFSSISNIIKENPYDPDSYTYSTKSTIACKEVQKLQILKKIDSEITDNITKTIKQSVNELDTKINKIDNNPKANVIARKIPISLKSPNFVSDKKNVYNLEKTSLNEILVENEKRNSIPSSNSLSENYGFEENFTKHQSFNETEHRLGYMFPKLQRSAEDIHGYDPKNYVNPQFVQENVKSRVLYIRGINNEKITFKVLYNLFSNYGNIHKMLLIKPKFAALIEFESIYYATQAKDHLNNIKILGNQIKIFYSNFNQLFVKSQKEEIYIGNEESFNFKTGQKFTINAPSKVLHISNLNENEINESILMKIFEKFGKIEKTRLILNEFGLLIGFVKYEKIEDSINAVAFMNSEVIFERKIQVTFTRSKI